MSEWEEAAQTWRKHANLSQKGPGQMVDLNPFEPLAVRQQS